MKTPNVPRASIIFLILLVTSLALLVILLPQKKSALQIPPASQPAAPRAESATAAAPKKAANFDKRSTAEEEGRVAVEAVLKRRLAASERLSNLVPGAQVDFDEKLGTPKFVASNQRFLTGAGGVGGAVTNARASEFANLPHAEVKAFIAEFSDLFGHGPEVLDSAEVKRDFTTEHNGLRTTVWQQQLDGIRVFESTLMAHVTKSGELVNVASTLLADVEKAAGPDRQAVLAKPTVNVRRAIRVAAAVVGDVVPEDKIVESDSAIGQSRKQKFRAPAVLDVSAEYVWLPLDGRTLRLCWEVVHVSKKSGEMFQTLVDAQSGLALVQHGLTAYISPASYRVFTSDSPTPMSPGHATQLTTQPPLVSRTLVTLDAMDTTASPNGWINDGGNETVGNNVDAHLDLNADNVADTPRPQGSPSRVFDPAMDTTQAPSSYRDASVVNLFYWNNRIHDRYYQLGFTEASGNFQTNNFGRGGNGNDAVQADSQDGSGTNNANFSTPADGSPGRMQMFVFTGPSPQRDSSFDAEIVIHEYTHGLSNRLVGGGVGISASQSAGMGEGWSDFYALCLLSEVGDDVNGNYAAGAYGSYLLNTSMTSNYYSGIRRYPYTTNLSKNPLTFRDIDPTQASAHSGIPLSPLFSSSNSNPSEVHGQGEVWCVTLWDLRAKLVLKHGAATGNDLAMKLVTDGMKLAPANPNMLQARDAILQAELVYSAGANRNELWAGFAKRGMGATATSPASSTTSGVVENYDLPDDMSVSPAAGFTARGNAGGPFDVGSGTFTVRNNGTAPLNWTAAANQPWLSVSQTSGTLAAGTTATVTVSLTTAANSLVDGLYAGSVNFTNTTSTLTQTRTFNLRIGVVDYFTELFSGDSDVDYQSFTFTPNGSGSYYRAARETVTAFPTDPAGGTSPGSGDDTYFTVALSGGATVSLYGTSYSTIYMGTNGYLTFGSGDYSLSGSLSNHFTYPRVAAVMTDLYPGTGQMTWKQTADRVAFTWQGVRLYGGADSNNFQIEMFFDGRIRVTFLRLDASSHLVGLSRGTGTPTDFTESDFSGYPPPNFLTLTLPARVAENAGTIAGGLVTATPAPSSPLTVNLTSGLPGMLSIPASVTIPANSSSAAFSLSPVNNSGLNGSRTVSVSATATGNASASVSTIVDDDESDTLVISVPATATEGDAAITGTASISGVAETDVSVALSSSNTEEITLPASVQIPAGQSSATFTITVVNDNRIDGNVSTTITASVPGWTTGTGTISINDNEAMSLTVTLPTMREGDTGKTGTVTIPGTLPSALTVSLSSSDSTAVTVPGFATIAAGATSATFALTIVDDAGADGPQPVTVTATAAGFANGTANSSVADNDAHHFTISAVASPQIPNAGFTVAVTAWDVSNAIIANFNSPITLSAAENGGPVAITPTLLNSWTGGVATVNVRVLSPATNVLLTASDSGGHTGTSNSFDVIVGPLHHFGWSTITSPQPRDTPFAATITAQDVANNTVTAFNGVVAFSGVLPAPSTVMLPVNPATSTAFSNGLWSGSLTLPFVITNLRIRADDGAGHTGDSSVFNVQAAIPPANSATVFAEDFESGVFGPWWTISGISTHRTQITTANTPHGGTRHMTMDSSLDGSYARNEATLTVNLSGRTGVLLRYWAIEWNDEYNGPATSPFSSGADFDGVAISQNGTTWYEVQPLDTLSATYTERTVDLDAAIAARGLTYNSTFKIRFNHYDDYGIATDGFGFDDISISANAPTSTTTLSIPAQVTEGSGLQTGTITLATQSATDRVVTLTSGAPTKISVPASITVPAGGTSANFTFTVLNDSFLDGNKTVFISATAPGDNPTSANTLVVDDDQTSITLSLSAATAVEGGAAVTASATLGAPPAAPITLTLSASPAGQVVIPATLTFDIGETTKTFPVTIIDDTNIDGSSLVTLTLVATGWTPTTATLTVADNENTNLALTVPTGLREGVPTQTGTVTISGTLPYPLDVNLTSSDTTELTLPATVTIPAGQTSVNFAISIIDDTDLDGAQNLTITASTSGFTDATVTRSVDDNDAHHFSFATIGSPQVRNGPIPVTVTARDIADGIVPTYSGSVTLTAAGASGALSVTPGTLTGFTNGVKTAFVQINASDTGVQVTATDSQGHTGTSNPFDLAVGDVASFAWDTVPSPQTVDTPFSVRIRALDSGGSTAVGFNGAANLGALTSVTGSTIGSGATTNYVSLYSYYQDARSNSLYTAAELGGAGRLSGIAYNFTSVAGTDTLTNLTIRLKHTSATTLSTTGWDNTGWTQVYRGSPAISTNGWMMFNFSTPFDYDGTSNLVVDVSFDRAASSYTYNYVQATGTAAYGTLYSFSDGLNGDPLTWTTTPPQYGEYSRADIRLLRIVELPIRPSMSGNFTNGVWDGQVSLPFYSSSISLRANAGTLAGTSNSFSVSAQPPAPATGATVLSEDFESGTLNPNYWTISGNGGYRTINTTQNGPHGGLRHMTMDEATGSGVYARNEATLSVNLANRTGVHLKFWAIGYSEDPDGPPTSPFPSSGANFDGVAISADGGTNWYEIQPLRSLTSVYTQYTVDLDAAIAARGLTYGSNFKIRFNQYDNYNITTDGIGIDDILITATPLPDGLISIPSSATEGATGLTGTITLPSPKETDTWVTLSSTAPAKLSVPVSVLIPFGQTTVTFPLTLPEDTLFDGTHTVYVTATVPASVPVSAATTIFDNETGTFALSTPTAATEGNTGLTGTVSINPAYSGALTVALSSSDPTELTVPANVTISIGQTNATFPITIVNDAEIDGTQSATITASAAGITSASAVTQVSDNETRTLALSGPIAIYEGQTSTGTVSITGTLTSPLIVTLTSSNPTQYSVPATVTIPAGSTSANFTGTAVDDAAMDGTATAVITASAATFTNATYTTYAYDNDVHHFSFITIATSQVRGQPFSIAVYARDVNDSNITAYTGNANLSAATGSTPLAMTPTVTGAFSSGQWYGSVTVSTAATLAAITATNSAGITGTSNTFNVGAGALAGLAWAVVPSPQTPGVPFTATLSAQDAYGNTVNSFNGTANIAAGPPQRTIGTATTTQSVPFNASAWESRSQMIYLASEVGAAGRLTGLAFDVSSLSTVATRFTIRMKHTSLASYTTYAWDTTGWTTVFQGNVTPTTTGLLMLNFATPFDFNGTSNLMIDCSFDGASYGTDGTVKSYVATGRNMYYYTYGGTDPLTWLSTNPYYATSFLPTLKLRTERTTPLTPTSVTLANGVWVGNLTMGASGTNITLTADTTTGLTGESSQFSALLPASLAVTPSGPLSTTGYRGGPFTPLTYTFTLSNPGSTAVQWSANSGAAWLSLSSSGGTIAAGGNTTVTATLNNTQLAALPTGTTTGVITFTNTTNGNGNTTRTIQITATAHGNLTVLPGANGNYTLTNNGDATLNWSLASSEDWATPTATTGSLNAGANTTVNVQLGAVTNSFLPGHYSNTLSFTNVTTGHGNTVLVVPFDVLSSVPQLLPEPPVTGGTTNTLNWTISGQQTTYQVETAPTADFATPVSSGPVNALAHTFTGLPEGSRFYRARTSESLRSMRVWSQTSPTALGFGTKTNVAQDATGIVLLSSAGPVMAGRVTNPGFEAGGTGTIVTIPGWTKSGVVSNSRDIGVYSTLAALAPLPTDGALQIVFFTYASTQTAGDITEVKQSIDFTGTQQLRFDHVNAPGTGNPWNTAIRAQVLLDNTVLWSSNAAGSNINQSVDVSTISGFHDLKLRMAVETSGSVPSQLVGFDNIRIIGTAGYPASGTLVSPAISNSLTRWGTLRFSADTPAGTGVTVDILNAADTVIASNVSNGADLAAIPSLAGQTSIRLRANLATTNPTVTPRLTSWLVSSIGGTDASPTPGAWSNVVSSVQDATGPSIIRTSALAVGSSSYTPNGTALDSAGVQSVTVNGIAVSTADAFATWNGTALSLIEGANTVTVVASDTAVPPNTTTASWTVTLSTDSDGDHLPDSWEIAYGFDPNSATSPQNGADGDSDGDGYGNLLEYALGLDPTKPDTSPQNLTIELNPTDGMRYAVYHFRRRAGLAGWNFDVLSSSTLGFWNTVATETATAPTSNPDGVGETVHLRILPAVNGNTGGFFRLKVTAP